MTAERHDDSDRQADFDSRFAEIVSQFGSEEDDRPGSGPGDPDEDTQDTEVTKSDRPPDVPGAHPGASTNPTTSWRKFENQYHDPKPQPPDPLAGLPSQWRVPDGDGLSYLDDEEDFVPPPPAPLPKDDLHFWAILATLIGGPMWVFYLAIFDRYARSLWWVLAVGTCVAGVVLLVLRQPKNHDDPDDDLL
ncbi:hypothetical protein [Leekyejoonella antrihumi]|uniref:Uncharacterized protein n=1 Tax=Leekyejoonella antrihumi TaxID=1660198 RepID=A0A563E375_9MICO|nr:hypothetical protein [Leekyejoonella antrihumi]TWP36978.1 hypothetical protein FGL98_07940 [Leekyejoonella antrihumi]